MRNIVITLTLLISVFGDDVEQFVDKHTLEIVHVVFRHGDRTPESLYPTDPYTEETFYPIRLGHLTNKGKRTAYKIGTSLRNRYRDFIPKTYTPEIIQAISSHIPRTKASLQLVLAGLFPPTEELKWNNNLLWQPIPYDYLPLSQNKLFLPNLACPNFDAVSKSTLEFYEDPVEAKYRYLLPFLQNASGLCYDSVIAMGKSLYSTLKAEDNFGLELPAWTKDVYPEIVGELSIENWVLSSRGDLKTLTSGYLVSRIINNTYATIRGDLLFENTKIYLYSGHDSNIAGLLLFLDNFIPHNPNYGAHIIIEVHKISETYYLQFLHQNYDRIEPKRLNIPNCGVICPLDTFIHLYAKHLDPEHLNALCG